MMSDLIKLRLLLLLHLIPINILHLDDLGFLGCKNGSGPKVGMKLILESIIIAQIFAHCIGIDLPCLFHQLPTLGIVDNCMLVGVIWRSHDDLTLKISQVSAIKFREMLWGVRNDISGMTYHLQPLLIFNVLLVPPPVTKSPWSYTTTCCC